MGKTRRKEKSEDPRHRPAKAGKYKNDFLEEMYDDQHQDMLDWEDEYLGWDEEDDFEEFDDEFGLAFINS